MISNLNKRLKFIEVNSCLQVFSFRFTGWYSVHFFPTSPFSVCWLNYFDDPANQSVGKVETTGNSVEVQTGQYFLNEDWGFMNGGVPLLQFLPAPFFLSFPR